MTDIWLVTAGEYSDYSVFAAFTNQERALAYAQELNEAERREYSWRAGSHHVERFDLDPPLPSEVKAVVNAIKGK